MLDLWKGNTEHNTYYNFVTLKGVFPAMKQKLTKKFFVNHLDALQKKFWLHFSDVNILKIKCIVLETHLQLTMYSD
jgi:hypothetical protein